MIHEAGAIQMPLEDRLAQDIDFGFKRRVWRPAAGVDASPTRVLAAEFHVGIHREPRQGPGGTEGGGHQEGGRPTELVGYQRG